MKLKLRAIFLLTFMSLTVFMIIAEIIAMHVVGKPYIAERMATDVCVPGSVRKEYYHTFRGRDYRLKCTSKETGKEINVPFYIGDIADLLTLLLAFPIVFLMAGVIVLGERLFFNHKPPPQEAQ